MIRAVLISLLIIVIGTFVFGFLVKQLFGIEGKNNEKKEKRRGK